MPNTKLITRRTLDLTDQKSHNSSCTREAASRGGSFNFVFILLLFQRFFAVGIMFFEAGVKFRDLRTGFQLAACMSMLASRSLLLNSTVRPVVFLMRGIARIPHYEYHIRFDPRVGRKRPCQDVLDRFKRLNNGMSLINRYRFG